MNEEWFVVIPLVLIKNTQITHFFLTEENETRKTCRLTVFGAKLDELKKIGQNLDTFGRERTSRSEKLRGGHEYTRKRNTFTTRGSDETLSTR